MKLRAIVPVLLAAILTAPVAAQQAPAQGAQSAAAAANEVRSSIKFPGGTVAEYVATLIRGFPGANIAVAPGVESVRVAPVELTKVNINEAVFALPTLCESQVSVDWFGNTAVVDGVVAKKRQGDSRPSTLKVWSMAEVLSQIKSDDALSAIQVAIELAGPGAEVKFHADTSLLIVRGSGEQIDAVQQTISRLESSAALISKRRATPGGDTGETIRRLTSDRDRLAARVAELEGELQRLKSEGRPAR